MSNRESVVQPTTIILGLILLAITALFLGLTISYAYSCVTAGTQPLKLPFIFILNTIILIASSFSISWAQKAYLKDDTDQYRTALLSTLGLSMFFLCAQYFGWNQMYDNNMEIDTSTSISYLYIISIVHFLHVIGGLPFLILFVITAFKRMKEPVSVLIYFSDPTKRAKLNLLSFYWHYLDALWIYLVVFFLALYLLF